MLPSKKRLCSLLTKWARSANRLSLSEEDSALYITDRYMAYRRNILFESDRTTVDEMMLSIIKEICNASDNNP